MIRRARRDGREARSNEEREKREDRERGKIYFEEEGLRELDPTLPCSHCFFKSSGYNKLELKNQNLFLQAYRKHY